MQIRKKNVPKHFYSLLTSSNPALYLSGCRWQEYQKGVIFFMTFKKSIALLLSGSMLQRLLSPAAVLTTLQQLSPTQQAKTC